MAPVARIQNHSLNLPGIGNAVRAKLRLDCFSDICARDQKFSILLDQGKAQPTARTVDHDLAAAADKFERIHHGLEPDLRPGRRDFGGQPVKLGNIIDTQVIVTVYFDDLPIIRGQSPCSRQSDASGEQRNSKPTFHRYDHQWATVSNKHAYLKSG